MSLFGFGRKAIKGEIGYFGLEEWWLSVFSDDERRYISQRYQPLGSSGDTLTSANISYTSQTVVGFLQNLASWFSGKNDRPIGYKILAKVEELADDKTPVLARHFLYQTKLELHYKDRENPIIGNKPSQLACNRLGCRWKRVMRSRRSMPHLEIRHFLRIGATSSSQSYWRRK